MSVMSDRLAALRAANKPVNNSPRSNSRIPSTLSTFLILYVKSSKECNLNWNEGAKALYHWLTYPNLPLDFEVERFPVIEDKTWKVPATLAGYETSEIAALIAGETYGTEVTRTKRAIAITTVDLVMRGII